MDPIYLNPKELEYELLIRSVTDKTTAREKTLALRELLKHEASGACNIPDDSSFLFSPENEIQTCSFILRDILSILMEIYESRCDNRLAEAENRLLHVRDRVARIRPNTEKDHDDVKEVHSRTLKEIEKLVEFKSAFHRRGRGIRHSLPNDNQNQFLLPVHVHKSLSQATVGLVPNETELTNFPINSLSSENRDLEGAHGSSNPPIRINESNMLTSNDVPSRAITPEIFQTSPNAIRESLFDFRNLSLLEQREVESRRRENADTEGNADRRINEISTNNRSNRTVQHLNIPARRPTILSIPAIQSLPCANNTQVDRQAFANRRYISELSNNNRVDNRMPDHFQQDIRSQLNNPENIYNQTQRVQINSMPDFELPNNQYVNRYLQGDNEYRDHHVEQQINGHRPMMRSSRYGRPCEPLIEPANNNNTFGVQRGNRRYVPVNQWRLSFSGDGKGLQLLDFLSQILMYQRAEQVPNDELLYSMIHLFTGRAKLWFQSVYDSINNWDELVQALKDEFLPSNYEFTLFNDISNRKQKPNESFSEFITHMKSLFKWIMVPMSERHKLFIIQNNLLPKYALAVAPLCLRSLEQLSEACKRIDNLAVVNRPQALPFENPINAIGPRFNQYGRAPNVYEIEERFPLPNNNWEISALSQNVNRYQNRLNPNDPRNNTNNFQNRNSCWNCGSLGHSFRFCTTARRGIFCYTCGLKEVTTKDCNICTGNGRRDLQTRAGPQDPVQSNPL